MKARNLFLIFVLIMSFILTACGSKSFIGGLQTEETSNQPIPSEAPAKSQEGVDNPVSINGQENTNNPPPIIRDVAHAILVANEDNRIIFRLTSPNLQTDLANSNEDIKWSVWFSLNGDKWYADVHKFNDRDDFFVSVTNNPVPNFSDRELAYARVFFEENDIIIDFLVYDNYSFDWDTLEVSDVFFELSNYEMANLVVSDIKRQISEIAYQPYPCITEINIDPDDFLDQTTLTAVRNADGTANFTYNNRAIKHEKYLVPMEWFASPLNTLQRIEFGYIYQMFAKREGWQTALFPKSIDQFTILHADITINNSFWFSNQLFDIDDWTIDILDNIYMRYHYDQLADGTETEQNDFNAYIDENGLTITWTDEAYWDRNLDELVIFLICGDFNVVDRNNGKSFVGSSLYLRAIDPLEIMR